MSASTTIPRVTFWKLAITAACVCVFVFAMQAKLAQYDGPDSSVTPVKAAKLWNGDSRIELQDNLKLADFFPPVVLMLFLAALPLAAAPGIALARPVSASRLPVELWQVQHFFRPPPAH